MGKQLGLDIDSLIFSVSVLFTISIHLFILQFDSNSLNMQELFSYSTVICQQSGLLLAVDTDQNEPVLPLHRRNDYHKKSISCIHTH